MDSFTSCSDLTLDSLGRIVVPENFNLYVDPPDVSIPLHAPIPLTRHSYLLQNSIDETAYTTDKNYAVHNVTEQFNSMTFSQLSESPVDLLQSTFPTPSELLAELATKGLSVSSDEFASDMISESASKARRRATAKSVGFIPTDPDTISSHDKKRHYLECLEQYIAYLHEQFQSVGAQPTPLARIGSYRGLNSRSIRTLLVHMENVTRRLNDKTLAEEQKFIALRDEIIRREYSLR